MTFIASVFICFTINRKGVFEIYFLDVGQGDAVYIKTPSGKDMLIDGGRSTEVLRRLSEVMPWNDRSIDVVVETHPDADHIGGFPLLFERYDVGVFIEPGIPSRNSIDGEMFRILKEKSVPSIFARRGMVVDFGDGAVFDILYPDKDVSTLKNINDASVIGKIVYGSTSAMITGDAPQSVENILVSFDGDGLNSDILKAGHHGSRTSSAESFVRMVNPRWAIISVGKDNVYKHPHQEIIDLFKNLGISILRTDEVGTISFVSNGNVFERR